MPFDRTVSTTPYVNFVYSHYSLVHAMVLEDAYAKSMFRVDRDCVSYNGCRSRLSDQELLQI